MTLQFLCLTKKKNDKRDNINAYSWFRVKCYPVKCTEVKIGLRS